MLPISTFNGIQKNRNLTMIKINTENKRAKYCCYLHKKNSLTTRMKLKLDLYFSMIYKGIKKIKHKICL